MLDGREAGCCCGAGCGPFCAASCAMAAASLGRGCIGGAAAASELHLFVTWSGSLVSLRPGDVTSGCNVEWLVSAADGMADGIAEADVAQLTLPAKGDVPEVLDVVD